MESDDLVLRILAEMRSDMSELRGEMGEMKGDVGELKSDVREIKDRLGVVDGRLGVIEDTMLDLASQVHVLGRGVRVTLDARRRNEALFADLDRRITEIERGRGKG